MKGKKRDNHEQNNRVSWARNHFGKSYLRGSNSSSEAANHVSQLPTNNALRMEIPAVHSLLSYQRFIFSMLFLPSMWLPKPIHVLIGML